MYIYEISDILFFIKSLKTPKDKFNILNYVSFNTGSTRPSGIKLHHKTAHTNAAMSSCFFRLPRLWNSLPIGRLYRAGTRYTVLPAILPAVEGIILRMLRALKKTCTKNLRKRKKMSSMRGLEPGHPYS